jgi:N-acetylmuramoyl-L-alanine amidase
MPGDQLTIPEIEIKQVSIQTERRHSFVRKGEPAFLPIQVLDNGRPLSNKPYRLTVEGTICTGTTDSQGIIRLRIAGNARNAHLVVGDEPDAREYQLALGEVDPLDCVRGIQQRLVNLGYGDVAVTGELDEASRLAIMSFQAANGLPQTGELDDQTRAGLREKHGH